MVFHPAQDDGGEDYQETVDAENPISHELV
jgi:hypothetical protein